MTNRVRYAGMAIAACVLAAPVAILATVFLFPFWSWLEERTGIESLGHSGPAEWCFAVTYVLIAVPFSAVLVRLAPRR